MDSTASFLALNALYLDPITDRATNGSPGGSEQVGSPEAFQSSTSGQLKQVSENRGGEGGEKGGGEEEGRGEDGEVV